MKSQRLALVLTVINLLLLMFTLSQGRSATARGVASALRGSALEIVDDRGKLRAQIVVQPAAVTPDGRL